jgi:hypothetical protein
MESMHSSDSRWQQLIAVQGELERPSVILPELGGRGRRARRASPRAVRFAQALACEVGWSGISEARARRAARLH